MAAISTNAIPAAAPAPAKASAHDIKAPADDSFAAILNLANNQPAQPAPSSDDTNSADAAQDSADTQDNAPATAKNTDDAKASDKPGAKTVSDKNKTANDNDAQAAPLQAAAQPDAGVIVQAQAALIAVQTQTPQAVANDDEGGTEECGAVDAAAKPGAKAAPAPKPDAVADAPGDADGIADSAAAKSPAATAQAAINGDDHGANKDSDTAKRADTPDKAPAKTTEAGNAPRTEAPQQPQQAQSSQPAPSITAAVTSSHNMPVQTASTSHDVQAQVQVSPHTPTPDVNNLAVEIAARSQNGARQFSIRLDPPELGRVDVRLSIDATGKTEAHLTADHPETLNLLQKDSSTLTQALRASGLDVSQSGLNFSLRGQHGQQGNDNGNQGRGTRSSLAASRVLDAAQTASSITFTGAGTGRLDIHV